MEMPRRIGRRTPKVAIAAVGLLGRELKSRRNATCSEYVARGCRQIAAVGYEKRQIYVVNAYVRLGFDITVHLFLCDGSLLVLFDGVANVFHPGCRELAVHFPPQVAFSWWQRFAYCAIGQHIFLELIKIERLE